MRTEFVIVIQVEHDMIALVSGGDAEMDRQPP